MYVNSPKCLTFVIMLKCFTFCCVFFAFSQVYAQSCTEVYIHGRVVDTNEVTANVFYNMMVVNATSGRGVFGSPNGKFSTYAHKNDSITISVKGFQTFGFRAIPDSNCQVSVEKYLEPRYDKIRTVVIKPLKSLQEIKEEREALAERETRTVKGVNALESPITALYQALSKKEKARRWIAQMKYKDDQREVVKELLRLYTSYDIVKLPEDEFDQFIDFLNISPDFLKTASEMELVTFIKDKFEHYQRLKLEAPQK